MKEKFKGRDISELANRWDMPADNMTLRSTEEYVKNFIFENLSCDYGLDSRVRDDMVSYLTALAENEASPCYNSFVWESMVSALDACGDNSESDECFAHTFCVLIDQMWN